jgi:hypothetical protein
VGKVSEPALRRFGRPSIRKADFVTERDWERSPLLRPRSAPRDPELVSDGAGLPFPLAVLDQPIEPLDPQHPAVAALIAVIARNPASKRPSRGLPNRGKAPPPARETPGLDGWRLAARTDDEVLFTHGRPPRLVTVDMRRKSKRRAWTCVAVSTARPLRATREGIRASGWRLDPTRDPDPAQTELRVLVTEQTWAGGSPAEGRLLAPDLYVDADELVLTMFVTPRAGFQVRSPNPETPARIALPGPVGPRRLIDGALHDRAPGETPPTRGPDPDSG